VSPLEFFFGLTVVAILVGLAAFFTFRQARTMRQLSSKTEMSDADRWYFRGQARRRLTGSLLMLILAGILVGSYFMEQERETVTNRPDKAAPMQPEEREFLQRFTTYWVVALGVLFLVGVFALLDLLATLKYGVRQHRKLRDEHRADLEEHVRRLRRERNGDR
jgi:hypothetical protein